MNDNRFLLWLRWTLANGLAELLGLGATFAAIGLLVSRIDTQQCRGRYISPLPVVGAAILAAGLLVGAIHGRFLVRMFD
jgi:hypothetical protein